LERRRIGGFIAKGHPARSSLQIFSSETSAVDEVVFLSDGRVAAVGTYGDLLGSRPDFRAVVTREGQPSGVRP